MCGIGSVQVLILRLFEELLAQHGPHRGHEWDSGGAAGEEWDRSVQFVKVNNVASSLENNSNVLEARVRRLQDCEIKSEGSFV